MHNVNAYVNTFSFSFKLRLGQNTFFMEYLWATESSRYPPEKLFRKFLKGPQKTPLKVEESIFFNNVADTKMQSQIAFSYKFR